MFLKKLCATSPASIDPTWKIRRHIATVAYMSFENSLHNVTCVHRLHMEDTTSHRNGGLYVFEESLCDVTCIHRPHMIYTTSHRNGGLYVFDKSLRDVTCIHRLHMEDTTSHRNGGLYVFENASARRHLHPSMENTTSHRNGGLMFLTKICATSPAAVDPTWKIRRHIATDATIVITKTMRGITCIHRFHLKDTTPHCNGGLYVLKNHSTTSPTSIDSTWKKRRHIATEAYMF